MQENGSPGTAPHCHVASESSHIALAVELHSFLDPLTKSASDTYPSSSPNRDSGIFEDYSLSCLPQRPQGNASLEEDLRSEVGPAPIQCSQEPLDDDVSGAISSCDSDRVLHASLLSLDNEVHLSAASSSEEVVDEEEAEDVSDVDFSFTSSDTDLSSDAIFSNRNSSSSFGYHSLLNDATPNDLDPYTDTDDFTSSQLSFGDESEKEAYFCHNPNHRHYLESPSRSPSCANSGVNQVTPWSKDIPLRSSSASISSISFTEDYEEEKEDTDSSFPSLSLEFSSSLSLSSASSASPENESPSDIESKMAETEVKMHDALLSNGREELAHRTRRLRPHAHTKTKDLLNALGEASLMFPSKIHFKDKSFRQNNNLHHRNIHINNNYNYLLNFERAVPKDKVHLRPLTPSSLPLVNLEPSEEANCMKSSGESPIVDAYEKECRDAPEKEVQKMNDEQQKEAPLAKPQQESSRSEQETDLRSLELTMREVIQKKEAETQSTGVAHRSFDLDLEVELRPRPSPQQRRRERNVLRRSQSSNHARDRNKQNSPDAGEFDVYTMETALPKIDWEAIEAHLQATKEEEKRRRTDREEIRRKLAMGADEEAINDCHLKKPSLQSRLQSGKNLQICFMNETASDCESQCSDTESTQDRIDEMEVNIGTKESKLIENETKTVDFVTHQARLQAEARLALAQAKEMARMQMEIEKQNQKKSPITEIVKDSFNKIGFPFPAGKRRMSRQLLTDMNVAQLQVIVNDLHTQIENLNEDLVQFLLNRDDLHMEQDSMLVDIEDLTKHLGAKQRTNADDHAQSPEPGKGLLKPTYTKTQKLKSFVKM